MHACIFLCHDYPVVQIFKDHSPTPSGYLRDFRDGQIYQEHPLFGTDGHALQIIIYFDEIEVANPLGSHRGIHKLGMCMHVYLYSC